MYAIDQTMRICHPKILSTTLSERLHGCHPFLFKLHQTRPQSDRLTRLHKAACQEPITDNDWKHNPLSKLAHAAAASAAALVVLTASSPQALAALDILPSPPAQRGEQASQAGPSALPYISSSRLEAVTKTSQALPPIPSQFPTLPELQVPEITKVTLSNGVQVYLLPDHEVPLVRGMLMTPGGQAAAPKDKVGLSSVAAAVQRLGGSKQHKGEDMDRRLDDLAAAIESGAGQQSLTIDFECEAADTPEVLQLLSELVLQPLLPEDKLQLVKAQVFNLLEHQNDNPTAIAARELRQLIYGRDSIYARVPTKAHISSITREDMSAFLARWQRPDAALLGLVGDFEVEPMLAVISQTLGPGHWSPAADQPAAPPPKPREELQPLQHLLTAPSLIALAEEAQETTAVAATPVSVAVAGGGGVVRQPQQMAAVAVAGGGGVLVQQPQQAAAVAGGGFAPGGGQVVYLVDRPGATQASVAVGEPGISLQDPDAYALDLLSTLLNSFGGALFDNLRSREGLAYSVSASWDAPPDHGGLFEAYGQTSQPAKFLKELGVVLSQASSAPPTDAQVAKAKSESLNSWVFNFASRAKQLRRAMVYELLGVPQDFLFQYRSGIEAVTAEGVRSAAERHLHPGQQMVVVVGDAVQVRPQLMAAGFKVMPLKLQQQL